MKFKLGDKSNEELQARIKELEEKLAADEERNIECTKGTVLFSMLQTKSLVHILELFNCFIIVFFLNSLIHSQEIPFQTHFFCVWRIA